MKKLSLMEKKDAAWFGVDIEENTKHTWKFAIKEVNRIQHVQTPKAKL